MCHPRHAGAKRATFVFFFFQAEDGIRDGRVTGVQTCALPIFGLGICGATKTKHREECQNHKQTATIWLRSEERRVGKSVDLGGRRSIKKKKRRRTTEKHGSATETG